MVPPPQDPDNPLGVATTSPDGNESVNWMPVDSKPSSLGLAMVKVRGSMPLSGILGVPICGDGPMVTVGSLPKTLTIVGGSKSAPFTGSDIPVTVGYSVSVAVMVWLPFVDKVTGKCPAPFVSVESGGRAAAASVLVKCTRSL